MQKKKVCIIGGSVSGLALGCYLQMNNFETIIYELKQQVGGRCTAKRIRGITFENVYDGIAGINEKHYAWQLWQELEISNINHAQAFEIYKKIMLSANESFFWYADLTRLEQEWLQCAPVEAPIWQEILTNARKLATFKIPLEKPVEILKFSDYWRFLKRDRLFLLFYNKWSKVSVNTFLSRMSTAKGKRILKGMAGSENTSMFQFMHKMVALHHATYGHLKEGFEGVVQRLQQRYEVLGGRVQYGKKVLKIEVDKDRAKTVLLEDDTKEAYDWVVSALDVRDTYLKLFDKKQVGKEILKKVAKCPPPFSGVKIYATLPFPYPLGARKGYLYLEQPIVLEGDVRIDAVTIWADMAVEFEKKKEQTAWVIQCSVNDAYFVKLWEESTVQYEKEVETLGKKVSAAIMSAIPELSNAFNIFDVHTAVSYSMQHPIPEQSKWFLKSSDEEADILFRKRLPTVSNFFQMSAGIKREQELHERVKEARDIAAILCEISKQNFHVIKIRTKENDASFTE